MPFQIIEIVEETNERNIGSLPYDTKEEAIESAMRSAETFQGENGYDEEHDHWWGRDLDGRLTRIYVEGI
jgi:hypothetical protein